jgi:purine-nucleoside phosphorylase
LAAVEAKAAVPFAAGEGGTSLSWNAAPPFVPNEQEEPAAVDALAAALPKADGIILFWTQNPKQFKAWAEGKQPLPIDGQVIYEITVTGRAVLIAVRNNTLVRAAAKLGLAILVLSSAFVVRAELEHGKIASISDHINISGTSPLVGRNKSGTRFPGLEGLYRPVPGLDPVKVYWQFDFARQSTAGNKAAAAALGADVLSGLGPAQAIVARHAGAKNIAHIVVQEKQFEYWTIPEDVVALGLFA